MDSPTLCFRFEDLSGSVAIKCGDDLQTKYTKENHVPKSGILMLEVMWE